jgi:hypothetical protein
MPQAFELHVLKAEAWTIDTIFCDREAAVTSARELHALSPGTSVRVIAESFDPDTGVGRSRIIYEAPPPAPAPVRDREPRRDEPPRRRRPPPPPPPAPDLPAVLVRAALALAGLGLAAVLVLTWLGGFR